MWDEKSPLVTASTKDIITFLDDVRIAIGLNPRQMDTVILLLMKTEGAHLHFHVGNMDILFGSNPPEESGDKEITAEICTSQKKLRKHHQQ